MAVVAVVAVVPVVEVPVAVAAWAGTARATSAAVETAVTDALRSQGRRLLMWWGVLSGS
ncbi:hypothetical protein GCM10027073_58630 [Streptomyces chlorus]